MNGPKYSVSQFVKAMASAPSVAEQAKALEQINVDLVDMVNQIRDMAGGAVPYVSVKTVDDLRFVVAQCAMHLRVIRAQVDAETVDELKGKIEVLQDQIEDLEDELEGDS